MSGDFTFFEWIFAGFFTILGRIIGFALFVLVVTFVLGLFFSIVGA